VKRIFVVLIGLVFLVTSCLVTHTGNVSSGPLMNKSDKYSDIGVGTSKSVFVFGIGDLSDEDLVLKAKKNLFFNRPLQEGEYYSNFTTAITDKFFLFVVHTTKVSVSADVLKSNDSDDGVFDKNFKRLINSDFYFKNDKEVNSRKIEGNNHFVFPSDSVYYANDSMNYGLYTVSSVYKNVIMLKSAGKPELNKAVSIDGEFFIKNLFVKGLKSGDTLLRDIVKEDLTVESEDVIIMGVSQTRVLARTKKDYLYTQEFVNCVKKKSK
jgi:hypothetical protein